ncbi:MAG: methyltransferase domain-containing protein [Deltaproteobacteria bacterium]|nr:methyltransferase domain-containing protein [Deltaproteobacteria bacterium]
MPSDSGERLRFPSGLVQPQGSFRFSMDALLLGAFARSCRPDWSSLLDLGCGCGAVAFAVWLLSPRPEEEPPRRILGLDLQDDLLEAARQNASLLGCADIFTAAPADLRQEMTREREAFDLVTANPPYHLTGKGRLPLSPSRRLALHGDENTLRAFLRSARAAMSGSGAFCMIFPFSRRDELLAALKDCGLYPVRLLPVQTGPCRAPRLILLSAGTKPAEKLTSTEERPLILRADKSSLDLPRLEFKENEEPWLP